MPDLLVVLADANDIGPAARRQELDAVIDHMLFPEVVIGTPDPYVERWLLADPVSFAELFGAEPDNRGARDREAWKTRLERVLRDAGEVVIHGGAEFATEIFDVMDFYRAGRQAGELPTICALRFGGSHSHGRSDARAPAIAAGGVCQLSA